MAPEFADPVLLAQSRIKKIPSGWTLERVGDVLRISNTLRKPISADERSLMQGPYPYYGPTKIQDWIDEFRLDGKYALIGEDGDHFLKYKNMAMTQLVEGKFNVNNHAHIIEGTDRCTCEWFYQYFKHREISAFLTRQGAGRYKLNKESLERIPLLVPPLVEQRRLHEILLAWDQVIGTVEKLIENSERQKKALRQVFLTRKGRLDDFRSDWRKLRLKDICSRVTMKNAELNDNVLTISAQQGLVPQETFFNKRVASETLEGYYLLSKGQFAYNKSYSNGYPMGAIKRLNDHEKGVVTTLYICFEVTDTNTCDPNFLEHYFDQGLLNRGLTRIANEGGRAHGLLNVKPSDFFALELEIPAIEEQQAIEKVLASANRSIQVFEDELNRLQKEKIALMQQLLTGKRRVLVDQAKEVAHA